jgi:hypothetical protein
MLPLIWDKRHIEHDIRYQKLFSLHGEPRPVGQKVHVDSSVKPQKLILYIKNLFPLGCRTEAICMDDHGDTLHAQYTVQRRVFNNLVQL